MSVPESGGTGGTGSAMGLPQGAEAQMTSLKEQTVSMRAGEFRSLLPPPCSPCACAEVQAMVTQLPWAFRLTDVSMLTDDLLATYPPTVRVEHTSMLMSLMVPQDWTETLPPPDRSSTPPGAGTPSSDLLRGSRLNWCRVLQLLW